MLPIPYLRAMKIFAKIFSESIAQAFQALQGNKVRSFLSLLGITIGIFCIIGVQSAVDSLQANVEDSFNKLGDDVVYIQKFPWAEDPHSNWWKWVQRPDPSFKDYQAIKKRVKSASLVDFHTFIGEPSFKYRTKSLEEVGVIAVSPDHSDIFSLEYEKGRYFSSYEMDLGLAKIVIGATVAENLFGALEPVGKKIKVMGREMEVVGVIKKSGDDMIKILNYDNTAIIPYRLAINMGKVKSFDWGGTIAVKAAEAASNEDLVGDLTFALRGQRRLRPKEEDNFAINELSIISNALGSFFSVFDLVGLVIGSFAILVGGFSVANIMFVSVRERTSLIGVKKALGAKKWIILLEFLIESILLCIFGGILGLALIYLVAMGLSSVMPFAITLSSGNIINGLIWSIVIGLLAGVLPAYLAANMDPVEAMRT